MSIIAWLLQNGDKPKYLGHSYYSSHSYYSIIGSIDLKEQINLNSNAYSQRADIASIDKKSLQNPFHFIFSNSVYTQCNDQWVGMKSDIAKRRLVITDNYITYDTYMILKQICKQAKGRAQEEQPLLISTLLEPFADEKASDDLVKVLTAVDSKGNSALHYMWSAESTAMMYISMRDRLQKLSEQQKECIASVKDKEGQTLIHIHASRAYPSFNEILFGKNVLRNAFTKIERADHAGNTPLHTVCSVKKEKCNVDKIQYIHQSIHSVTEDQADEKAEDKLKLALDVAFQQNISDQQNPFHLVCRASEHGNPHDLDSLIALKNMLPREKCVAKFMEKDRHGDTPLHLAIRSGNSHLVSEILKDLTVDEKKALAIIKNHKQETALHNVCRHGDDTMLDNILAALGSVELYKIRKESPNLSYLLENISLAHFNNKINACNSFAKGLSYFIDRPKVPENDSDFNARLDDFIDCVAKRTQASILPTDKGQFIAKYHLFFIKGSEKYQALRATFSHISEQEINEFKTYFAANPLTDPAKQKIICRIFDMEYKATKEETNTKGCETVASLPPTYQQAVGPTGNTSSLNRLTEFFSRLIGTSSATSQLSTDKQAETPKPN